MRTTPLIFEIDLFLVNGKLSPRPLELYRCLSIGLPKKIIKSKYHPRLILPPIRSKNSLNQVFRIYRV